MASLEEDLSSSNDEPGAKISSKAMFGAKSSHNFHGRT